MTDFLFMAGGPFHSLVDRLGKGLRPQVQLVPAAIALAGICWAPLMLLSVIQGRTLSGGKVLFLPDYPEHIRFLFAVPALILIEPFINERLRVVVQHFTESGVVAREDLARVGQTLDRVRHGRDSLMVELVLAGLAVSLSGGMRFEVFGGIPRDWLFTPGTNNTVMSPAAHWFFWVSMPLYRFVLLRWLWRYVLWVFFLRTVVALHLRLVPTHPDRVGGLDFVGRGQAAFLTLVFPSSCVVAATLYQRTLAMGSHSLAAPVVAVFVGLCLAIFLGPLIFFTRTLIRTKRLGLLQYGLFAMSYTRTFHEKWIPPEGRGGSVELGSPDIQSLADLSNSFRIIEEMRLIPIDRRSLVVFAVGTALPFLPLVLTNVPLPEIMKIVAGLVLGK